MQGSFTSDSADKFFQLMREAGYETQEVPSEGGLQNFSSQGASAGSALGDVWQGNVAEFGEVRGEYLDVVDFTRCERPDGSAYGSRGKCRKGTESAAADKPKSKARVEKEMTPDGKWEAGSKATVAPVAPVPPKPIKDPVPGILRSQAEVKKIIADRPETPNAIRNAAGQPLNLTIARVKALSDQDLESEWNRAKTKGRKDKLQAELDRREAATKATPKKETQSDRETRGEFARNAKDFQGRIKDIKDEIRRSADDPEMRKQIPALMKQMKMWEGKLESAKSGAQKPGKN